MGAPTDERSPLPVITGDTRRLRRRTTRSMRTRRPGLSAHTQRAALLWCAGIAALLACAGLTPQAIAGTAPAKQPSALQPAITPALTPALSTVPSPTASTASGSTASVAAPDAERASATKAGAHKLFTRAVKERKAHQFTRAYGLYAQARDIYVRLGDTRRARVCLTGMQDIYLITASYPFTRSEMAATLAQNYPDVPAAERNAWLDDKNNESMVYDGARHYFGDLPINLAYRDYDLFHTLADHVAGYRHAYAMLASYMAAAKNAAPWQPYAEPTAYSFTQTLDVPRSDLPATGTLDIWLPTPLEGGPQTDVRISNVSAAPWLNLPPSIDGDISLLYLNVALGQLSGDLQVSFDVAFKHAAQYFTVDPDRVGNYDTTSALYRTYTKSRGNTRVTPDIRRTARRVVGRETNPYLAARRLYRYILRTVKYSFMPHFALWPRGVPESVYVHTHRYGDCGAQGMYFSALCRSVGIPCRTTGGFQLFTGVPAGHFWAEFYLPNYGWIPVDPTAATLVDYLPEVSAADKQAFHDFFFGCQDDLRLVVQKDVDLPVTPPGKGRIALPLAVQWPAALCDDMTEPAGLLLMQHWTYK